jgi:hypothetical protein
MRQYGRPANLSLDDRIKEDCRRVRLMTNALRNQSNGGARSGPGGNVSSGCATGSTVVGAAGRAIPDGRAGRYPFSPGPSQLTGGHAASEDLPRTLYVEMLAGLFDWGNWPLDCYVFSDSFLRNLESQVDLNDVAWVCAMVACGLAHEFRELELQPRPASQAAGNTCGKTELKASAAGSSPDAALAPAWTSGAYRQASSSSRHSRPCIWSAPLVGSQSKQLC